MSCVMLEVTCAVLLAFPSDTPPTVRIPAPAPRELRAVDDVVLTARLANGQRVPSTIVLPQLRNRVEVLAFIRDNYPDTTRLNGPEVMPVAWVYVDESGATHLPSLVVPSGHARFDSLALAAVKRARFEPAAVERKIVPVWVMLPVQLTALARTPQLPRGDGPHFTPYTKKPELRNRDEVRRALVQNYPTDLRKRGIGGTTLVWVLVDESGRVVRAQVREKSGHPEIDVAALRVAKMMEWTPAENRGAVVPVWVSLPIVFKATSR